MRQPSDFLGIAEVHPLESDKIGRRAGAELASSGLDVFLCHLSYAVEILSLVRHIAKTIGAVSLWRTPRA